MGRLRGTLISLMADIEKVKAEEKALIKVERDALSSDYESICKKCDLLKSIFPDGYETVKKRYSSISWFKDPVILKSRLSQSGASMATAEVKILYPELLDFEARRLMQAECGYFENGVFHFDLEKANRYFIEARKIANLPTFELKEDSCLKGSIVNTSKKRLDWRRQEKIAVNRMLEELSLQREERKKRLSFKSKPITPLEVHNSSVHKKGLEGTPPATFPDVSKKTTIEKEAREKKTNIKYKAETEQILQLLRNNNIRFLYHFTSKENIPSIKKYGGLFSWHYLDSNGIKISVPGGDSMSRDLDKKYNLQDYVRLSFCKDHPMAYRLRISGENIVLLIIDIRAAAFLGTQYSDMNAADRRHHHGSELSDLERIKFDAVKRTYVSSTDPDFKLHQAEVMVKTHVPSEFILNLDDF